MENFLNAWRMSDLGTSGKEKKKTSLDNNINNIPRTTAALSS